MLAHIYARFLTLKVGFSKKLTVWEFSGSREYMSSQKIPTLYSVDLLGSFENSYIPGNPRTPPISYISQTVIPFKKPTLGPSKTFIMIRFLAPEVGFSKKLTVWEFSDSTCPHLSENRPCGSPLNVPPEVAIVRRIKIGEKAGQNNGLNAQLSFHLFGNFVRLHQVEEQHTAFTTSEIPKSSLYYASLESNRLLKNHIYVTAINYMLGDRDSNKRIKMVLIENEDDDDDFVKSLPVEKLRQPLKKQGKKEKTVAFYLGFNKPSDHGQLRDSETQTRASHRIYHGPKDYLALGVSNRGVFTSVEQLPRYETHHDFLDVYVRNPRDRGMEAVGFREIKLGFEDLDQEHMTYMNLLEESSRTCITLGYFQPKKEKRKTDFDGFRSLHVFEIDNYGARTHPSLDLSLEISKI
ncbi:hypothetical protein LXL04_006266 [Taraxacum kok-saghyz]